MRLLVLMLAACAYGVDGEALDAGADVAPSQDVAAEIAGAPDAVATPPPTNYWNGGQSSGGLQGNGFGPIER